jgi:hypothetical protein
MMIQILCDSNNNCVANAEYVFWWIVLPALLHEFTDLLSLELSEMLALSSYFLTSACWLVGQGDGPVSSAVNTATATGEYWVL